MADNTEQPAGRCEACGYCLPDTPKTRCPECGLEAHINIPRKGNSLAMLLLVSILIWAAVFSSMLLIGKLSYTVSLANILVDYKMLVFGNLDGSYAFNAFKMYLELHSELGWFSVIFTGFITVGSTVALLVLWLQRRWNKLEHAPWVQPPRYVVYWALFCLAGSCLLAVWDIFA